MGDELDLEAAFLSAAELLNLNGYELETRFYPYAGLKSTIKRRGKRISAKVSDGYKVLEISGLTGLAVDLMVRLFRLREFDQNAKAYLQKFRELNGKGAYSLHESLRSNRGRKRKGNSRGEAYDLGTLLERITKEYVEIFPNIDKPEIFWSRTRSERRLAFYDSAFNQIVVSKKFDDRRYPEFFLEYLIFHELLHAKHETKFGKKRRVHHREFLNDERRFSNFEEAQELIKAL